MTLPQQISAVATALAIVTAPATAIADFYDGFRGPSTFQLDQRLTLSQDDVKDGVTYTLLPKGFIDTDNDGTGAFAVTPFSYALGSSPTAGLGAGGFVKIRENASMLGVVPVLYHAGQKAVTISPTLFTTVKVGDVLLDPRLSYAATISEKEPSHQASIGTTVGYQRGRVLVGLDVEASSSLTKLSIDSIIDSIIESLAVQGIIRIDLDDDHTNWLQTYVAPTAVTEAWRTNL
ncbi:hypothetical protein HYS47_04560 [Candidatus Woesearchaeota archaeon]|nr:hypothetical protein [Candidatus Woesearchaeota archaeon]